MNLAKVLREELTRIARREARAEMRSLRKAVVTLRTQLAGMRREASAGARARRAAATADKAKRLAAAAAVNHDGRTYRFVRSGFLSLRKRLGLSAKAMGLLLGVSEQSIYNWETTATPNRASLARIAALRKLGKREAQALVANARHKEAGNARRKAKRVQ